MTLNKLILSLVALLLAIAPLALGQGTYTQIDVPGAIQTTAYGINSGGDIVGGYEDGSGLRHGFLLSDGVYTTIDYETETTTLFGINDVGQIVGLGISGFIYDLQTQAFTLVNYPGLHVDDTTPMAINNDGTVVGHIIFRNLDYGFELSGSTYSKFSVPGSKGTMPWGISALGKVVGYAVKGPLSYSSFYFDNTKFRNLMVPNLSLAFALGINPAGTTVVGSYPETSSVSFGFVYDTRSQTITSLQFPGSDAVQANGINANGEVVGIFYDSSFNAHGFTWTPPAAAEKK